jgi:hypothetical protein
MIRIRLQPKAILNSSICLNFLWINMRSNQKNAVFYKIAYYNTFTRLDLTKFTLTYILPFTRN